MKIISTALLAACAAAPAMAQSITLDFEGAPGYVNSILEFYNGGTDSLGQTGINYGVSFTDAAVGLSNDELGPYYSNAPSPLTVLFANDATATMNVAAGFVESLSFQYSASAGGADLVNVYSGLNGTGTLLASVPLSSNATLGCSDTAYCHFDLVSVSFAGVAKSVNFGGNAPGVLFDNISITAVPEPSTYLLLAAGLLAVGAARRRRND